ncbi:MAG: AraC family transcriptional regulator [Lentisphaerae bacterium]|nr:AraC family transcriptional regulator [Lentisphaerota bacterium]
MYIFDVSNETSMPPHAVLGAPYDPEVQVSEQRLAVAGRYVQAQVQAKPVFSLHAGLEIGIVLSGRILRCWEGCRRVLQAGDVWFTGVFEPHGSAVVAAPCTQMNLAIWPDWLANLRMPEMPEVDWLQPFLLPPARRPRVPPASRPRILALAHRIPDVWKGGSPEHRALVRLRIMELLLMMRRLCPPPAQAAVAPPRKIGLHARLTPALQLGLQQRERLSAARAAQACDMHTAAFQRSFRRAMGISFTQFALRHRISGAAADLAGSNAPLKAIAANWGFTDTSHLFRVFVEHYHCSPSDYRRRTGTRS